MGRTQNKCYENYQEKYNFSAYVHNQSLFSDRGFPEGIEDY